MKKIIKKVGNSLGVYFTSEDCKIFDLKVGDKINVNISHINWDEINKRVDKEVTKEVQK